MGCGSSRTAAPAVSKCAGELGTDTTSEPPLNPRGEVEKLKASLSETVDKLALLSALEADELDEDDFEPLAELDTVARSSLQPKQDTQNKPRRKSAAGWEEPDTLVEMDEVAELIEEANHLVADLHNRTVSLRRKKNISLTQAGDLSDGDSNSTSSPDPKVSLLHTFS